ncbi:MAG TPA: hypothetical protein VNJ11_05020 [Bryobacteraceae bacterium]|nr:hypothetical protein [Bryobacteraceae bacterium]
MQFPEENHIEDDELELYALGRLCESRVVAVEEHVLICESCQDRLAETEAYVEAVRAAAAKLAEQPAPWWRRWWERLGALRWTPKPVWATASALALLAMVWGGTSWFSRTRSDLPPVAVALVSVRGEDPAIGRAPAGRPLRLEADLTGLEVAGNLTLELVDSKGTPLERWAVTAEGNRVKAVSRPLPPGRYWVRLYAAGTTEELLREYGFEVR